MVVLTRGSVVRCGCKRSNKKSLTSMAKMIARVCVCVTCSLLLLKPVLSIALSSNQRNLGSRYRLPETWVPLASVFELDGNRPNPVLFLGNSYVCYQSKVDPQQWVVVDNVCPHRLAPLSEGRINEHGLLECSYHGWAFNSNGQCCTIPQADDTVFRAAVSKPQCHVRSYPVMVYKSVVWAWLWPQNSTSATLRQRPEGMLKGRLPDDAATFTRDLPYGWDTLLENIADPAHVPWVRDPGCFHSQGIAGSQTEERFVFSFLGTPRASRK